MTYMYNKTINDKSNKIIVRFSFLSMLYMLRRYKKFCNNIEEYRILPKKQL